jgi:hypothetical protein
MEIWNDDNRFNQTGYSASTIFPIKENYINIENYNIDLAKANLREESHLDWLEEEISEAKRDAYYESLESEESEDEFDFEFEDEDYKDDMYGDEDE